MRPPKTSRSFFPYVWWGGSGLPLSLRLPPNSLFPQKILLRPLRERTITLSWIVDRQLAGTKPRPSCLRFWQGWERLSLTVPALAPLITITNGLAELKAPRSPSGFDARFGPCDFSRGLER